MNTKLPRPIVIPLDVLEIYIETDWMYDEYDVLTADLVEAWRTKIRKATRHYRNGGPMPDWSAYRHNLNEILTSNGYPALFTI